MAGHFSQPACAGTNSYIIGTLSQIDLIKYQGLGNHEPVLDLAAPRDLAARFEGEPDRVRLHTHAGDVEAMLVSVGNPHCVVFGQPVTKERCLELGPLLERHEVFPERTNVQLFEVLHRGRVRIEIWERGAAYTLASATTASAVAAACIRAGLVAARVPVHLQGDDLAMRNIPDGTL